jgi:hypothetical protein
VPSLLHARHPIDTTDDPTAKSELQTDPIIPCTIRCTVQLISEPIG